MTPANEFPHSPEPEASTLAACLIDGATVMPRCLAAGITEASFHVPANAVIFAALRRLHAAGRPTDVAVVAEELSRSQALERAGGLEYLVQVSGRLPTAAQADYFIERVRELEQRRAVIRSMAAGIERARNENADLSEILDGIRDAIARGSADQWSVVCAADLAENFPLTPPEIVHGLLYQGGTWMMSGASKSMKTFIMIANGLSVASGTPWLGFPTSAVPVLYLNLELQPFAMASRVAAVAKAMGIKLPANFYIANLRGQLVDIAAVEAHLTTLLQRTQAGLVIIDPHYKISAASGVEENSNDQQGLMLYRLENVVCKSGAALMIAHHFAKGDASSKKAIDRAAGGGALARWPDVVMTLTEHEEDACATVEFSLRNFAPVAPFVVRWRYPLWSRDESVNPSLIKKAGRTDDHPASELQSRLVDGMSNAEWREASGWSDGTFRRKREELTRAGKVRLTSGCYYHVAA